VPLFPLSPAGTIVANVFGTATCDAQRRTAMITEDQSAVVAFLSARSTHGGHLVEQIDSHASIVWLAGDRAWKMKRAVRYDYLDFSTVQRRQAMCEQEVRVNRRSAPGLYLGVVPVTREADGRLAIGGDGRAVEWLVSMTRFDQAGLLDRLATRGLLDLRVMTPLGQAVAHLHAQAPHRGDCGGAGAMAWVIDGNAGGLREFAREVVSSDDIEALTSAARARLGRDAALLDARQAAGLVRQCHGDLHLRNVVLLDGQPTLFDGIEFNDQLSCIDVAYDVAFLLMDLWRRDLPAHANAAWNAWLAETDDYGSLPLWPLLLSCRAAVRAKTSATAASMQADDHQRIDLQATSHGYLDLAQRFLAPRPPCVVAIGGLSGSGKSTLARALAAYVGAAPGAVLIRSDELRKRLFGVSPLTSLGAEGYAPGISQRVYAGAAALTTRVAAGGHGAVVDAVFARAEDRQAIAHCAAAARLPFVGLWIEAAESVRLDRTTHRGPDASDATAEVVRRQRDQLTGAVTWHRLDGTLSPAAVLAQALGVIGAPAPA
jgi:aminoglycoside phosphotransferase family enzyme/predicted kinase